MRGSKRPIPAVDLAVRFRATAACCGGFVIALPVVVLIGWAIGNERMKRVIPGLVEMNPLTAVAFMLCGAALWMLLLQPLTRMAKTLAIVFSLLVVCFGLVRIISLITAHDVALDTLLFHSSLHGNRLAPNTAACFVLLGLALAVIDAEWVRKFRPAQMLSLTAGAVALVALIGYAYSSQELYGVAKFIPMALHAAVCFIALCCGILSARPESGAMAVVTGDDLGGMLARRLLAMAVAAPILFGWLRLVAVRKGLISDELSNAVLAIVVTALFSSLVWMNARLLRTIDADRRRVEQRYRAVVQQTAEGIYLLDAHSKRIVESNSAFQKLLGYTPEQAADLTVYDIVDHDRKSIDQRIAETLEQGHAVMGERVYRRRDGTDVEVQANASVITYGGQAMLCTVVHDITRRRNAEREIQEKNRQLEAIAKSEREALAELRRTQSHLVQTEKLVGLGQMVAGVAHEINNPLSFVSNNVAVLQRDLTAIRKMLAMYQRADALVESADRELMEEIRDLSERMDLKYTLENSNELLVRSREGLRRIQQIVKDLREFARLDESDLHDVDLNEGIESTVNIIRGMAKKKQVEIEMDLKPLPTFACYPAKLNQVVMNLLSNALDASGENTKVVVRSRPIEDGGIEIQVEDQGTGIPKHIVERIFDPFFTTKPPGQGTGLGLSISYGIVKDHEGTFDVRSEEGKGTCFTVRLPRRDMQVK